MLNLLKKRNRKKEIKKKEIIINKIDDKFNVEIIENNSSEILLNSVISPIIIIKIMQIISITLSATIVPIAFSKGIFSYFDIIVPLATSPALGIV